MNRKYPVIVLLFLGFALPQILKAQHKGVAHKDSAEFVLRSITAHSVSGNFSAVAYDKGIVFCSDRPHEVGVVHFDAETGHGLLDLYYAELKDSFRLGTPHYFSDRINTPLHEGPASFSSDGKTIYYTSSGSGTDKNLVKIMESHLAEGGWSTPKRICGPDTLMPMAHPAISPDGKTLYFSSTQKSGFGKADLYKIRKTAQGWSAPENLGRDINTPGNESFPFVDASGKLFFSSDGQPESAKLDVYSARSTPNGRYEVRHLAYPINSEADDFGFSIDSLGRKGFVSSNRSGGKDEIYVFYDIKPLFCNCEEMKPDQYCFTFFEEKSESSRDTAGIIYEWDFGDKTKARGLEVDHCYQLPGQYTVDLNVVDGTTGVLFYNQSSYQITVGSSSQLNFELPDTVYTGMPLQLDASKSAVKNSTIESYYWDTGDGRQLKGSKSSVTFAEPGMKTIRLGCTARNLKSNRVAGFCKWKQITVLKSK